MQVTTLSAACGLAALFTTRSGCPATVLMSVTNHVTTKDTKCTNKNQSTKRLMPFFSLVRLKFISSPIFAFANLMQSPEEPHLPNQRNRVSRFPVHGLRSCCWKQSRKPQTRIRKRLAMGLPRDETVPFGSCSRGPWHMSGCRSVQQTLSNGYLANSGLGSLLEVWTPLAPKFRNAWCGPAC